jgi:hypothetical protein
MEYDEDALVTDYYCIHTKSLEELNVEMTRTCQDGWQPFGPLVIIQFNGEMHFYQPVVELKGNPI